MPKPSTFAFGANWNRFLRHVTEDRVRSAERSLTEFMDLENLQNRSFLDIGCGSGIFSYAAFRLGAERVVSFDQDPLLVECCAHLRREAGSPVNWEVHQASILDNDFTSRLGSFDVVYAWGTLQHTGKMWEALRHSTERVKTGGYLYIAIYNQVEGMVGSKFWRKFKRGFNALPRPSRCRAGCHSRIFCRARIARSQPDRECAELRGVARNALADRPHGLARGTSLRMRHGGGNFQVCPLPVREVRFAQPQDHQ